MAEEELGSPNSPIRNSEKAKALRHLDSAEWTWAHWKTVLVAGTGFLTDSYDNFIISLCVPMIAYIYYGSPKYALPAFEDGWIKAASVYGNLVGQLLFGTLADILGRKRMYGVELLILIVGAIGCAFVGAPVKGFTFLGCLGFWRFILGVGIGGDYPVSAVISSEFASTRNRGTLIALVFAMQGIGILLGAIVTIVVLACFKDAIIADPLNLDYCWRIMMGFGVVPALSAVYFRLTITETPRFTMDIEGDVAKGAKDAADFLSNEPIKGGAVPAIPSKRKVSFVNGFLAHFSKWENAKILIATSVCWFLLDIGFYGTNLNTSVVLAGIGYSNTHSPFEYVWSNAVGNLIVALCGNVPGYFFTVFFVDRIGRKPIQIMGFTMLVICFVILAAGYTAMKQNAVWAFVLVYSIAQFFFNFGPNSTTFIIPAEIFPTQVRSSGHGISAASGKFGAILAAQCFSLLVDIGGKPGSKAFMPGVLGIFAAIMFVGLCFTFLLPETMNKSLEDLGEGKTDPNELSNPSAEMIALNPKPTDTNDLKAVVEHPTNGANGTEAAAAPVSMDTGAASTTAVDAGNTI